MMSKVLLLRHNTRGAVASSFCSLSTATRASPKSSLRNMYLVVGNYYNYYDCDHWRPSCCWQSVGVSLGQTTTARFFSAKSAAKNQTKRRSPNKQNHDPSKQNNTNSKQKGKQQPSSSSSSTKKKNAKKQSSKQRGDPFTPRQQTPEFLPPALLLPTASPFAYVALAAVSSASNDDDNDNNNNNNSKTSSDPREIARTIFADVVNSTDKNKNDDDADSSTNAFRNNEPFAGSTFEYFPPKSFQHELPRASDGKSIIPEVAFLGRSNVGKSSLINAVMKRDLARCSKHPGRTQQPYYFGLVPKATTTTHSNNNNNSNDPMIRDCQGFLVDLPGYGFAKAPDKAVEEWQQQTQEFLMDRRDAGSLQRLFLLIDARRGMSQTASLLDLSVMRWMDEEAIPYTIVITKADCVHAPQLVKVANEACMRYQQQHQEEQEHLLYGSNDNDNNDDNKNENDEDFDDQVAGWMGPVVHITSAKKGDGLNELRSAVEVEFRSATY